MQCRYCDQNAQFRDQESGAFVCPQHARLQVAGPQPPHAPARIEIRPASQDDYVRVLEMARYFWDETEVACFGATYDLAHLPALLAWVDTPPTLPPQSSDAGPSHYGPTPAGTLSYVQEHDHFTLVLLNVLPAYQGRGVGRALVQRLCELAWEAGARQIQVATSNDDLPALSFYQRAGFHLTNVLPEAVLRHHGGVEEIGFGGIPVRDEIHLVRQVTAPTAPVEPKLRPGARRPRLGLALSGGAALGLAHIGVLEALTDAGIDPDCVTGVSAGSVAGALYCAGIPVERLREEARQLQWPKVGKVVAPHLGFFDIDRLADYLDEQFLHGATFDQLPLPFATLATDLLAGQPVLLKEGRVSRAVRASCSLPGIFTPVEDRGRLLVDGALVNNVPVSLARELGAEVVIAVDVHPPVAETQPAPRNILEMWGTTLYMLRRATHWETQNADLVVYPDTSRMSLVDLSRADELMERGRQAIRQQLPRIRDLLRIANPVDHDD